MNQSGPMYLSGRKKDQRKLGAHGIYNPAADYAHFALRDLFVYPGYTFRVLRTATVSLSGPCKGPALAMMPTNGMLLQTISLHIQARVASFSVNMSRAQNPDKRKRNDCMTCGSRTGIMASSTGNPFNDIRKMTVRRYAPAGDNHVDLYELTIRDNSGSTQNPQTGDIYPSEWIGTFSNLFDGNHFTRWHTNSYPGGYVDEFTTPMGYIQASL